MKEKKVIPFPGSSKDSEPSLNDSNENKERSEFSIETEESLATTRILGVKVSELDESSSRDVIKDIESLDVLDEKSSEKKDQRRHYRYKYGGPVVIYDDMLESLFKGSAVDLNGKGVKLITKSNKIRVNQTLVVEFLGCMKLPPFRALCEVKYVFSESGGKSNKQVGLKFVKLSRLADRIASRYRGALAA